MMNDKLLKFQDQIFFENLGPEGTSLQKDATPNIKQYYSMLDIYLKSVKKIASDTRFTWERINLPEDLKKDDKSYGIKLSIYPGMSNAEQNYAKTILERIMYQDIRALKWGEANETNNHNNIRIINTYEDENFITVETLPPENSVLSPDISDFSIQKEKNALRKLMDNPEKHHVPLLRLAAPNNDKFWEEPDFFHDIKWKILKEDSFPGVSEQRDLVSKALFTKNFAILEGPPGAGKTTVISEIILQMLSEGKRLLLIGSTHVAVDNVLEKLIEHLDIVVPIRIATLDRELPPEIEDLTYSKYVKQFKARLLENLKKIKKRHEIQEEWMRDIQQDSNSEFIEKIINDSINLVSGTSIGVLQFPEIRNCLKKREFKPLFDAMIIDEASKTTFQEFIVPAMFSRKWIISGDPKQLSPYADRNFIEAQIENLIKRECELETSQEEYDDNQYVCLTAFDANRTISDDNTDRRKKVLILIDEERFRLKDKLLNQLKSLNADTQIHIVPEKWNNADLEKLIISGSDIIISKSPFAKDLLDAIPYGCVQMGKIPDSVRISYQNNYLWKDRKSFGVQKIASRMASHEGMTLSQEMAWRMERVYEMRLLPQKAAKFKNQVMQMVPSQCKNNRNLDLKIWDIMYCNFPSIVELLTNGNLRIRPPHRGSVLESGLPEDFKKLVWTRLSFQYRMHPEISRFPRELVYTSEYDGTTALRDSSRVIRKWNYKQYDNRVTWINVFSKKNNDKGREYQNVNQLEAATIKKELDGFLKYAEGNKHPDSSQWTVAILSFYKPQTRHMQSIIRQCFKGRGQVYFNKNKSVKIFVGNVDSMQGREADIVFLSMVRSGGLGFLDNANRINVAITRAKYQLVVVGNHRLFCNAKFSDTLIYKFAKKITPDLKFGGR